MDIWVRSQDKKILCKVESLIVQPHYVKQWISQNKQVDVCSEYELVAFSGNETHRLGYFQKEEDGLQVINDFQQHVSRLEQEYLHIVALAGSFACCPHYNIFQIPKDKHV